MFVNKYVNKLAKSVFSGLPDFRDFMKIRDLAVLVFRSLLTTSFHQLFSKLRIAVVDRVDFPYSKTFNDNYL